MKTFERYKSGVADIVGQLGALKQRYGECPEGVPTNKTLYKIGETFGDTARKVEEPAKKFTIGAMLWGSLLSTLGLGVGCSSKEKEVKQKTSVSTTHNANLAQKTISLDDILKKPECKQNLAAPRHYTEGRFGHELDYIIFHMTKGSGKGALTWLTKGNTDNGAHYLIMENGNIVQMVDEKNSAHHCGKPWNYKSIGIEMAGYFDKSITEPQKESLAKLATFLLNKYNLSFDSVKGHNDLVDRNCPGINKEIGKQTIRDYIMGLNVASADKDSLLGRTVLASAQTNPHYSTSVPVESRAQAPVKMEYISYTVEKGDTCSKIARENNVSLNSIRKANEHRDINLDRIHPGDKILIPGHVSLDFADKLVAAYN